MGVGAAAGARDLGCTLYELDPGAQAVPYHMHHGNEQLLIVLHADSAGDYMALTMEALKADAGS